MRKKLAVFVSILTAASCLFAPVGLVYATSGVTFLSKNSMGDYADGNNQAKDISSDGQYVLYRSNATNLSPAATDGHFHLYIADTQNGTNTLVPFSGEETGGAMSDDGQVVLAQDGSLYNFATSTQTAVCSFSYMCSHYYLSKNGEYAAFSSIYDMPSFTPISNGTQTFVKDLASGSYTKVSVNAMGSYINSSAFPAGISDDGGVVLYTTNASDAVFGYGADTKLHLYTRDASAGTTSVVDASSSGVQANANSAYAVLSGDGQHVQFSSNPTNLVSGARSDIAQSYIKDIATGAVILASKGVNGNGINNQAFPDSISSDGSYAIFDTMATDVAADDNDSDNDAFLVNTLTGKITAIYRNEYGTVVGGSASVMLSGNGRYAAYASSPHLIDTTQPDLLAQIVFQDLSDTILPVVTGTPDRLPNAEGWYNDDVTIDWTSIDPEPSSGTPTTPSSTVADQEGEHVYTSGSSCDPAGNCATGSVTIKIDKTKPTISDPVIGDTIDEDNNVVISADAADALSGVAAGEYYVDTDPGAGNATAMAFDTGKIAGSLGELTSGVHTLGFRSKDKAGNWSNTTTIRLLVYPHI